MGIQNCTCKRGDSEEEEVITRIFKALKLSEMDVKKAYTDFLTCVIVEEKIEKSGKTILEEKLNLSLYNSFICRIVDSTKFRDAQVDYFQTLININDVTLNGIKRIGNVIIFFSDGAYGDKITILEKHVSKYYGKSDKNIKEFISDEIELQTEMCLLAFKSIISKEMQKEMSLIWKKHRKQKLIMKLMNLYQEAQTSHDNSPDNKVSLLYRFFSSVYNNLCGESIRSYLYEEYLNESVNYNNKFTIEA